MMRRLVPYALWAPSAAVAILVVVVFCAFMRISFLTMDPVTGAIHGPLGLNNYQRLLIDPATWRVIGATFSLSAEVTVECVLIGFPLAALLARASSLAVRRVILFSLVATFLSGGVTRAYAWMEILGRRGAVNQIVQAFGFGKLHLINNPLGVNISVLSFVLPFFVITFSGALRNIHPILGRAAMNLGASQAQTFRHVVLPLALPGLGAATSLVFVLTLGAFLFPQLLGGGRVHVLATAIFQNVETIYDLPTAATLAAIFLALVLAIAAVLAGARGAVGRLRP